MIRLVVRVAAVAFLGTSACSSERRAPVEPDAPAPVAAAHEHAHHAPPEPPLAAGGGSDPRSFGAPIDDALPEVALADIESGPERYRDAIVRTRGTVVRVCQAMGCWMELAADGTRAVRVPMAGHAFFLPRDAAGRSAEVVGTVRIAELSAAMRAHLEHEGAVATGTSLAIEASSVVLR